MRYLALGDSISIDDYTGVPRGGAASQFARLVAASEFDNLTFDGCTTDGVLRKLGSYSERPDAVTLTAGGNDFLMNCFWGGDPNDPGDRDRFVEAPLRNLSTIADRLAGFGCPVIMNTIYDPTDGDDSLAEHIGAPGTFRPAYERLNRGIRDLAAERGFLLSDLQALFRGHGVVSPGPWIVGGIEPNYAGAKAIAAEWYRSFRAKT